MSADRDPASGTDDLFDAMMSAAHAHFALSAAVNGVELDPDEATLVDAAIASGVVGALEVLKERDDGIPNILPARH